MIEQVLSDHALIARSPEVIGVRVGTALVLHDPVGDRYMRLNSSAEAIWEVLGQPTSVGDLADALAARYRLDRSSALRDVRALIEALLTRRIVVVRPG